MVNAEGLGLLRSFKKKTTQGRKSPLSDRWLKMPEATQAYAKRPEEYASGFLFRNNILKKLRQKILPDF